LILALVIIVPVIVIHTMKHTPDGILLYSDHISNLKASFIWPSGSSWKILNVSLHKQIFKLQEPEKSSIIILVGTEQPIKELYSRISDITTQVMKSRCPPFTPTVNLKSDDSKEEINTFVYEQRKNGVRCIYVPNIDSVPPNLGPSLHSLADELNPPYRDMIYVFSLITSSPDIQYKSKNSIYIDMETEPFIIDVLRKKWVNEMGEERFAALISRLCVNVVGVVSHIIKS